MSPALSAADDRFHPPPDADPWWTETSWFSFWVPQRRLSGALYPFFRPNLGVCASGVFLWDDTADEPWAVPYARSLWHLPMPSHDLTELSLPDGLSYECLEPLRRYRLRYADGDEVELDLHFEGLFPPHAPLATPERGHLDQPGHVTGTLRLHGEELVVDCLAMRDRSWSHRPDTTGLRAGYCYASASAGHAFHAMSMFAGDEDLAVAGYLVRDGHFARLTSGRRRVAERDDRGRPVRVEVVVEDVEGRSLEAAGRCVNHLAFQANPGTFAWMSLTRWSFDGVEAWGEHQDIWTPTLLRAARFGAARGTGRRT
ncbi:MAG: hypothetical protein M5U14_09505 [Acidimicrobiia bacterium]|nr:hypothetical protein [Acidimicrobiia bacterium]